MVGQGPGTAARQYAAVGAAAGVAALARSRRGARPSAATPRRRGRRAARAVPPPRRDDAARFVAAYRQYCWPVEPLDDLKLAPFHLLATEGHVHTDKNHVWHMETLADGSARPIPTLLLATAYTASST